MNKKIESAAVSGEVLEAMREALNILRGHKLRSALVIIGVTIGVASLMGMVATLAGLEKFLAQSISGNDTPILSLQKVDFLSGDGHDQWEKRRNFDITDKEALEKLPHVRGVMVVYGDGTVAKYKDRKAQLMQVVGTNQPFLHVNSISVGEGRFFSQFEEDHRRKVAVMTDKSASALFPDEDPIGKFVRLRNEEYQIVGVLAPQKTVFGGVFQNYMVIPYSSYERDFLWRWQGPEFRVIVESKEYLDEAQDNVRALMRMRRKVPLGEPDDFALVTSEAAMELTKKVTDAVALVLVVLASIALMVGGIGVMVIMLVSVTERTREIGIRKAIGATRRAVTWQFLIEAATLTGIGGLLGILVGIGLAGMASAFLGFPFVLPLEWVFISVVISAAVGLFFGIFPARKAAKLDPIVALRYE